MSESAIINELDALFSEAVRLEYQKDVEQGYRHITTLSGGIDSRMALFKAESQGFEDILIGTFSQSGYIDEKIARRIAIAHKHEFLFYALDNGIFLKDIDRSIHHNEGMTTIPGLAHGLGFLSKIDIHEFGMLHTGLIGEVIKGDYLTSKNHKPLSEEFLKKRGNYLIDKIPKEITDRILKEYDSEEMYLLYEQCINGTMTNRIHDSASPFLSQDFMEFSLRIPPSLRYQLYIYRKWIISKVPEADKYIWEKTSLRPSAGPLLNFMSIAMKHVILKLRSMHTPASSMNPFDYWLKNNPDLRRSLDNYLADNITRLECNPELKRDIEVLYFQGNCSDKCKALTLLGAVNYHGLDCDWK